MKIYKVAASVILLTGLAGANIAQAESIGLPALKLPAPTFASASHNVQALNDRMQTVFAKQMKRLVVKSIERVRDSELRGYLEHEVLNDPKPLLLNRKLAKSA